MDKKLIGAICATTFLLAGGCGSLKLGPMTDEAATKIVTQYDTYDADHSFAYNLCRFTANSSGSYSCSGDLKIPEAEYRKVFGANAANRVDGSFTSSVALYSLPGVNKPGFFNTFPGWAHGAMFLDGGWSVGSGDSADNRFVAFVPVSIAGTKEAAINYVYSSFAKSYRRMFGKYGFRETQYTRDFLETKSGDWTRFSKNLPVVDKKGCDKYKDEEGNELNRCVFVTSHDSDELVGIKTIIPSWMPNAGEMAWLVSGEAYFKTAEGYSGSFKQRDMTVAEARGLPDNFYLLVPPTKEDGKTFPPFVLSNKNIYFYAVPKN